MVGKRLSPVFSTSLLLENRWKAGNGPSIILKMPVGFTYIYSRLQSNWSNVRETAFNALCKAVSRPSVTPACKATEVTVGKRFSTVFSTTSEKNFVIIKIILACIHTWVHTFAEGAPNFIPVPGKEYVDIFPVAPSEILRVYMYMCVYVYVYIYIYMLYACMWTYLYTCAVILTHVWHE